MGKVYTLSKEDREEAINTIVESIEWLKKELNTGKNPMQINVFTEADELKDYFASLHIYESNHAVFPNELYDYLKYDNTDDESEKKHFIVCAHRKNDFKSSDPYAAIYHKETNKFNTASINNANKHKLKRKYYLW